MNTRLQELNKCKTELQYWRSTTTCNRGGLLIDTSTSDASDMDQSAIGVLVDVAAPVGGLKRKTGDGGETGNSSSSYSVIAGTGEISINTSTKKVRRGVKTSSAT